MKKSKKKLEKYLLALIFLFISSFIIDYIDNTKASLDYEVETTGKIYEEGLTVHYLDVGQGDATFLELPNNETLLIDSGEAEYQEQVEDYINKLGYQKIDYIIITHPHTDHMGGMAYIINNFSVGRIYMPKALATTKTYETLLKTISDKELKITKGAKGINIIDTEDLKLEIMAPQDHEYDDLNNYSLVLLLTYKNRKFLFMGDAEKTSEDEITHDVECDVVKIGHHGSNTSSSKNFVNKTHAKYAIISVGAGNSYGHPHDIVLKRWEEINAKIYRTDLSGTIIISTDGDNLSIKESGKDESNN